MKMSRSVRDARKLFQNGGLQQGVSLNGIFGHLLAFLVLIFAVPAGSNRTIFWALCTGIIAFVCLVYLAFRILKNDDRPWRIFVVSGPLMLAALIPIFALFQSVLFGFCATSVAEVGTYQPFVLSQNGAFLGFLRTCGYVIFFFLVVEISTRRRRNNRLVGVMVVGIVAHALFAVFQLRSWGDVALWGEKTAYLGYATGTFINRNSFASFLGMGLVLGTALFLNSLHSNSTKRRSRIHVEPLFRNVSFFAVLICLSIVLFATGSRMGTASAGLGVAMVFLIMRAKAGQSLFRSLGLVALAILLLFALILVFVGPQFLSRGLFISVDANSRLTLYSQVWAMILERPLLGYGMDSFALAFQQFHQPPLSAGLTWDHAHNSYLSLWAELGLIVGSLPIIAAVILAIRFIQNIRASNEQYYLPTAALAILVMSGVHALTDFSLEIAANAYLLLFILGLAVYPNDPPQEGSR